MESFRRFERWWLNLGFLLLCSWRIEAAILYQATGTKEEIQPVVDQFKHDIVYGPGGNEQHPTSVLGSFRVATFDDIGARSQITLGLIAERSNEILVQGFGSGTLPFFGGALVSAGAVGPDDPNRLFGDINPGYPVEFEAYSSPSILAMQGSHLNFAISDCCQIYPLTAFGAVFVGVDSPSSATIMLGSERAASLQVAVPPPSGNGKFSFVGQILDPGEVGMNAMSIVIPRLTADGQDAFHDMVAVDDVILGAVGIVPEPSSMLLLLMGAACPPSGRSSYSGVLDLPLGFLIVPHQARHYLIHHRCPGRICSYKKAFGHALQQNRLPPECSVHSINPSFSTLP